MRAILFLGNKQRRKVGFLDTLEARGSEGSCTHIGLMQRLLGGKVL